MSKLITAAEAAMLVKDNDTIAVNGVCTVCSPDLLCQALGDRFRNTQSPRDLTVWGATSVGISLKGAYVDAMFMDAEGLVKTAIMGQLSSTPSLARMVADEKIEGFNLPQGVISHLYRAAAGKKPVIISKIGLRTSVDPRLNGARLNEKAKNHSDLCKIVEIDGEEYIQYKTPKLDVCFICVSAADKYGNLTMDNEAAYVDAVNIALATKANGGIVIAQVEHITERRLHPKMLKIPGKSVDYIVVNPKQMQCVFEKKQAALNGDGFIEDAKVVPYINKMVSVVPMHKKRYDQYVIARRAIEEIHPGDVVNLGIGIPGLISTIATENGTWNSFVMTNEVGLIGGIPLPVPGFGATLNAQMITDMCTMFDFYDGGALDGVFVGAAQVDATGNVGVSKVGKTIIGVGGFINLTQSCNKIVFMTSFMDGKEMDIRFEDGKLHIYHEGASRKFVSGVEQVSFSGENAVINNQDVIYITERCVFRLTPKGLMIVEVAPGIDIEKDIIANMDFKPLVSDDVKIMDSKYFDFTL